MSHRRRRLGHFVATPRPRIFLITDVSADNNTNKRSYCLTGTNLVQAVNNMSDRHSIRFHWKNVSWTGHSARKTERSSGRDTVARAMDHVVYVVSLGRRRRLPPALSTPGRSCNIVTDRIAHDRSIVITKKAGGRRMGLGGVCWPVCGTMSVVVDVVVRGGRGSNRKRRSI